MDPPQAYIPPQNPAGAYPQSYPPLGPPQAGYAPQAYPAQPYYPPPNQYPPPGQPYYPPPQAAPYAATGPYANYQPQFPAAVPPAAVVPQAIELTVQILPPTTTTTAPAATTPAPAPTTTAEPSPAPVPAPAPAPSADSRASVQSSASAPIINKEEDVEVEPERTCLCIKNENAGKPLTPEQIKKKDKCDIITSVVGALVSFIFLILAIIAYAQIRTFSTSYEDVVRTWKQTPITDVQVITGTTCPNGYTELTGYWDGTYDACWCPNASFNTSDDSACKSDSPSGCSTRNGYPRVPLQPFDSSRRLCIQRSGLTALQRPSVSACGTGFTICGAGESAFCAQGNSCPVTDLAITNVDVSTNGNYPGTTLTKQMFFTSATGSPTTLYLIQAKGGEIPDSVISYSSRLQGSFRPTAFPLVDLSFALGDSCYLNGCGYSGRETEYDEQVSRQKQLGAGAAGYKLKKKCEGCSFPSGFSSKVTPNGRDVRFMRVYSRDERLVMTDSGVPNNYIGNSGYAMHLQYRSEILWKNACPRPRTEAADKQQAVDRVIGLQAGLLAISIISFLLITLAIPCLRFNKQCKKRIKKKSLERVECCSDTIFKIFTVIFTIVTMALCLGMLAYWSDISGKGKEAEAGSTGLNAPCADDLSTETFSTLYDKYNDLSYKDIVSTGLLAGTSFLDFAKHFLLKLC